MKAERTPYTTPLYIWDNVSAVFYSSYVTTFHSHNTLQLIFDLRKKFRCRIQNGPWGVYKSLIIKENVIHQLDTSNSVQLIIYINASSDIAKALKSKYLQQKDFISPDVNILNLLTPGELEKCLIEGDKYLFEKLVYQIVNGMTENRNTKVIDERVRKVITLLADENSDNITIRDLSGMVFLSESRLRYLFKSNTGVSLQKYIIWNKITYAISRIMNGATVMEAAVCCGFSDSSHFHKMILQMFQISPSQFLKGNNKRQIEICNRQPLNLVTKQYDEGYWNIEKQPEANIRGLLI
jgi:AraC-like DNA-binding protein